MINQKPFRYFGKIASFINPDKRFNGVDAPVSVWSKEADLRLRIKQSKILSFFNELRIKFSLSGRRDRIFRKYITGKDNLILDIGCGAGRHYLCQFGKVVGIDPEIYLLVKASYLYDQVYHANATELPFNDNTFDYVVSTDVIGHIADKDSLLNEIHRVLKPNGLTIHCAEVDSNNFFYRLAKQYPNLFYKNFIKKPGHYGLELASKLIGRFKEKNFELIHAEPTNTAFIREPGSLSYDFDNEYREIYHFLKPLIFIDKLLNHWLIVREIINILLELCIKFSFCDLNKACPSILIVFKKKV